MLLGPGCPDPIHYWKPGPAEGTREVGEKLFMHFEELQYSAEHAMPLQHRMRFEWEAASCA